MNLTPEELEQATHEYGLFFMDYVRKYPNVELASQVARDFYLGGYCDAREMRTSEDVEAECAQVLEDERVGRKDLAALMEDARCEGLIK